MGRTLIRGTSTKSSILQFPQALEEETQEFRARFGTVSATLQSHRAPWTGMTAQIPAHMEHGYRLLFAHLSLAPRSVGTEMWARYLCGSALPMKFCSMHGEVFDCWQQPVPIFDDESVRKCIMKDSGSVLAELDRYLDEAIQHSQNPAVILSHPCSFTQYSRLVIEHCLDRLRTEGMPIYNADEWLSFIDRRQRLQIVQEKTDSGGMRADILNIEGRFVLLFPSETTSEPAVRINGKVAEGEKVSRLGLSHLAVSLDSANHGGQCCIELENFA